MPKTSEAEAEAVAVLEFEDRTGTSVVMSARIPQASSDRLIALAGRTNQTTSDLIREAVRRYLVAVMSFGVGPVDQLAEAHGLTISEADHLLVRDRRGDDPADVVGEVKAARVGAAAPVWDEDALYARVTHGPNAGVVTQTPLDAA